MPVSPQLLAAQRGPMPVVHMPRDVAGRPALTDLSTDAPCHSRGAKKVLNETASGAGENGNEEAAAAVASHTSSGAFRCHAVLIR